MALADRQQNERRLRRLAINGENRSPAPIGLRNVVLDASTKTGSVACFGLAWPQGIDGNAIDLKLADCGLDGRPRRIARAPEILSESFLVNAQTEADAPRPVLDRLSLAVRGLHEWPVLTPELLRLLRRHRPSSRPLANLLDGGRLGRPIWREDELHLRRFILGHRLNLLDQLSLGHGAIVAAMPEVAAD
ncbi:MAG: hypothetical protein ACM3JL_01755 [Nitrososphaerota archaeon]